MLVQHVPNWRLAARSEFSSGLCITWTKWWSLLMSAVLLNNMFMPAESVSILLCNRVVRGIKDSSRMAAKHNCFLFRFSSAGLSPTDSGIFGKMLNCVQSLSSGPKTSPSPWPMSISASKDSIWLAIWPSPLVSDNASNTRGKILCKKVPSSAQF